MPAPRLPRPARSRPARRSPARSRPGRFGLHGAPIALPPVLDRLADRWWALPPRVRTATLVVLVVVALALVGRGATASPWGPPGPVLVAATDLPAGHPVSTADVRVATWPTGLVPDGALTAPADVPADARTSGPVTAGTVLTPHLLADGVTGLLAEGRTAVPVPGDGLGSVRPGDRVDVVATSMDGSGRRVATGADVLAVDGEHLWLGVDADAVDAVAAAGAAGRITLAVRPPGPG